MGTNGTEVALETRLEEEVLRAGIRALDNRTADTAHPRPAGPNDAVETENFALAPLVDKIAYGIAKGLVVAIKELENHIASETRKVGDSVDRRLDTLQASLQDLYGFVGEQRSTNTAIQGQLQGLTADLKEADGRLSAGTEALRKETQEFSASVSQRIDASTASLQDADARQAADLAAFQDHTKAALQSASERIEGLSRDLGVQQEDLAAVQTTLCTFSTRVDALVERLDRQAEAVRSMYSAYSQRETELEQLVDGLARLRAFPTPLASNGL